MSRARISLWRPMNSRSNIRPIAVFTTGELFRDSVCEGKVSEPSRIARILEGLAAQAVWQFLSGPPDYEFGLKRKGYDSTLHWAGLQSWPTGRSSDS